MVPAARRRSLLKSREFRGKLETLERRGARRRWLAKVVVFWSWVDTAFSGEDRARSVVSRAPSDPQ
jgi:hypothetical protein